MDAATAGVISTGAIGLAGIVGPFLSPSWNEQQRELRDRRRRLRTARRLVIDELHLAETYLESSAKRRRIRQEDLDFLALTEWAAHKQVLAEALRDPVWDDVSATYAQLRTLRWVLEGEIKKDDGKLGDQVVEFVSSAASSCGETREQLAAAEVVLS